MPDVSRGADARQHRFRVDSHGAGAWIHPYFGTLDPASREEVHRSAGDAVPMLYLVEQDPGTEIPAHFHQVPQFQVAVEGEGRLGAAPLAPVRVHYSGPFTGYGPIRAGSAGLSYLTARNRWDPGLRPLPQSRPEMVASGHRPVHVLSAPASRDTAGPGTEVLFEGGWASGSAWLLRLGSGEEFMLPGSSGQDRLLYVLAGEIDWTGDRCGRDDAAFLAAGTREAPAGYALSRASVLLLQFPA